MELRGGDTREIGTSRSTSSEMDLIGRLSSELERFELKWLIFRIANQLEKVIDWHIHRPSQRPRLSAWTPYSALIPEEVRRGTDVTWCSGPG